MLQQKAEAILKSHRVENLLAYTYEYHPATKTVGERYQITAVTLNTGRCGKGNDSFARIDQ